MPLINGLIPILILVALELLFSGLMLKSSLFSRLISGTPIVVVSKGKLDQKALKKLAADLRRPDGIAAHAERLRSAGN